MTTITGKIVNSASIGLAGTLIVTLLGFGTDDTNNFLITNKPATVNAPIGEFTIDLYPFPENAYNFQFVDTLGTVYVDFNALVPASVTPVNFTLLVETGLVTDVLDTSILRLKQLLEDTGLGGGLGGGAIANNLFYKAINNVSTTPYTLTLTDPGKYLIYDNGATGVINIPTDASVAIPTGSEFKIFNTVGFQVTITALAGVNLIKDAALSLTLDYGKSLTLFKRAGNQWYAAAGV